ncbi:MAG: hypothetical protein OSJ70_00645 [Bacilli bacterium]|nr:hypothetical protein [Bacilli bacterium]
MNYIIIALVFLIGWFIFWKLEYKVKIKYKTFLERGFLPVRGIFGVYCYCGKQGTGKTYSVVEYLKDNKKDIEIFCNIADIDGINYYYFTGFNELIELKHKLDNNEIETDKQIVIVYDEIFTELQKQSKLNKEIIDFLCQMRKRKIIFLTTAQEWAEIPLSFRRFCRYQIQCKMRKFLWIDLLFKEFHDAENMKWSNDEQEHIAPLIETTLTKCRLSVANSYDTFLRISSVPTAQEEISAQNDDNTIKKPSLNEGIPINCPIIEP